MRTGGCPAAHRLSNGAEVIRAHRGSRQRRRCLTAGADWNLERAYWGREKRTAVPEAVTMSMPLSEPRAS